MRRPKGVLLPPFHNGKVRRTDLDRLLRGAVIEGVLSPGDRLPSTRQAARDYGVSRGLMEQVFDQLTDEGFLERSVGRGTFVASPVAGLPRPAPTLQHTSKSRAVSRRGRSVAANAACREPEVMRPFNAGIADTSEFPWKIWCRLQARAARTLGRAALNFADPRGLPELRDAIARYLVQFRAIRCTAGQVVIFNSSQQALHAVSLLLLDRGHSVWIEDPCYLGARAAFDLAGATIVPVPVDEEGIVVQAGIRRAPRARAAYVTPSHQYPTGVALRLERRIELLDWAARHRSWVLEDDYDGEFRYAGQPLASLHSLDTARRVLYLGTLNKTMFASLRLAYLVVPEELVELLANIRTQLDGFTPAVTQMTTSLFMEQGYFSSHLRRMRMMYATKRTVLLETLAPLADRGWTWAQNPVGMHVLLRHDDGRCVRRVANRSSLDLALLSRYRAAKRRDDGLLLRFAALDPAAVQAGAEALLAAATT